MFNCYHAITRAASSRLRSSYHASSKLNDFHDDETTIKAIMQHSTTSGILEGRPCTESEYIRPRPSMARRRTRVVIRSQYVDESRTQSGTGETPPADTSAATQPSTRATPPVDLTYLPASSSSVHESLPTAERHPSVCTADVIGSYSTLCTMTITNQHGNSTFTASRGQLLLPFSRPTIWPNRHCSTPASTTTIHNTSPTTTRTATSTSHQEGIGDIIGVFLITQQFSTGISFTSYQVA